MIKKTFLNKQARKFKSVLGKRQPVSHEIAATMGDGMGLLNVAGSNGMVWVTIQGKPYKAYCAKVPPQNGKDVWVGREYVDGKATGYYQVLSDRATASAHSSIVARAGYAPASRYHWNGEDPLMIELRAYLPLRIGVSSAGGMNVDLYRGIVETATERFIIARQNIDLTTHIPPTADKAAFVLITIDDAGDVIQTKGSEVDLDALALADIPMPPSGTVFESGAVRVYNGQTKVQEGRRQTSRNTDIIDLRFGRNVFAGSGGGGVETVTGDGVDNTDPLNPVLSYPTPADIGALAAVDTDGSLSGDGTAEDVLSTASGATTAMADGTTTLTVNSEAVQIFTGTTENQTVVLPVTSTLRLGQTYKIISASTGSGIITVNSSGGGLVTSLALGTAAFITCIAITGTTAASWDAKNIPPAASDGDFIVGNADNYWEKKNLLQTKAILGIVDAPEVTATNDFQLGVYTGSAGTWAKKTLAETATILESKHDLVYTKLSSMSAANATDLTDGGITSLHKHRIFLPFSSYNSLSPMSATAVPFAVTIDRDFTLISWSQHVFVQTTNNGSNYWKLTLKRISDGATVNEISTAALSANTQSMITDTTFDISSLTAADLGLSITCTKTGSPGNLYAFGPLMEAE